jgi:two-component system sensor histidine kinase HydH
MAKKNNKVKMALTAILVVGISALHYSTDNSHRYLHIFYRELYFFPIVLAAFWFGLRGALATSLTITALFVPFTLTHWQNLSPDDFSLAMDKLLYNIVAVILGALKDQERVKYRRLLEAESLAGMGKALAGVAHDMKTPLIAIGGFTRLVQKKLKKDDPAYSKLDIVIGETRCLENMVRQMLDFSRPLELDRSQADINKVIKESIAVVSKASESSKVQIDLHLSNNLPPVSFDGTRMKQVLINLLMNAVQASPEGEAVTVTVYQKGGHIGIELSDNGCGIPGKRREEIFAPFFTTKKEGTGLGLPIAKKIIEAHKGHLELLDNPEKGVTFRVLLPIVSG